MSATVTAKFNGDGAAAASFTTASWTPDVTKQYLLGITTYASTGSVQPPTPTISGNSLTWTLLASLDYDPSGGDRSTVFLFACSGAGGTAGTMGIAFSTTTPKTTWLISEVAGADAGLGAGTLPQPPQTNIGITAATLSVTLSALQSGSVTFGLLGWQASSGTMSAGATYTQLATDTGQSLCWGQTEWDSAGNTTVDVGMSPAANRSGLIGIEIAAASTVITGTATFTGAGTFTAVPSGASTITGTATFTGAGGVTAKATQVAKATMTGAGTAVFTFVPPVTGYTNRPDFYFATAFNAAPNDTVNVPIWSELTGSVRSIGGITRGRQYELAQTMSADPTVVIRDPDEALNPDNTGSPYSGQIQPYRPTVLLGQWPNYGGATPPSGQTNLLNLNTWNMPIDPSFESYPVGALPQWVTVTGADSPGVVNTSSHTGSKSFQFQVLDNLNLQTIYWPLKCIPGRQYTASFWFRMSLSPFTNVFPIVRGCTQLVDTFGRTVSNGWGTAGPVGGAWSTFGGVAADYSVAGGQGLIKQSSTGVTRMTFQGGGFTDNNVAAYLNLGGITPTGAAIRAGVVARGSAGGRGYICAADFNPDNSITLHLIKDVAGTETILTSVVTPYTYDPTISYGIRIDTQGTQIQGKIWPETIAEPVPYNSSTTDNSLGAFPAVGCYTQAIAGNTNGAVNIGFDNLNSTAGATGASTLTVGSYVQLSVTFTASQPDHAMTFSPTRHVGATQIINIDDVQLDQAATVQARTTSGPTIYPIFRNYAERWTRSWDPSGYEGIATVPCVDALAALSATTIGVEYQAALDATFPLYSWPLNDSAGGTSFAEVVSGGPPLAARNGRGSPLTGQLTPGAPISIPGYPNTTGAQIVGNTDTFTGVSLAASGIAGIPQNGSVALTIAFWAQWTDNRATTQALIGLGNKNTSGFYVLQPPGDQLQIQVNNNGNIASTAVNPGGFGDGNPHFIAVTFQQPSGASSLIGDLFVDSIPVNPLLVASVGAPNYNVNQLAIAAGTPAAPGSGAGVNGIYAQVHLWDRALSAVEIGNLYRAGQGFVGETTGARVARHLTLGKYAGLTRISAGTKTMGPPSYIPTIDLNTDSQNTATAESGAFWIAPDGAVVFESSDDRYLRLTSTWKLGERAASGESPYQSSIAYDDDPTFIYANVQVARPQGINAVGGSATDIATANRRFFGRSLAATADLQNDGQAQSLANWTFYTHNRPITRIAQISLDPSSNTSLWPVAFGMEIGQRVTVTRRPSAANAGAGFTDSADFFIETVSHDLIDMDTGEWQTSLLLSPIGSATSGSGLTFQPWIIGDTTYGVVGVTSIPGY